MRRLPDLRRIARIAMVGCTREAKFEEVQRHYIRIYSANFFVMLHKIYLPLTYVKLRLRGVKLLQKKRRKTPLGYN